MSANHHHIAQEVIDQVQDAATLHEVIQQHVNDLKPKGRDLVGTCPVCHGKNFSVSPAKGLYKCFNHCGTEGNSAIKFLTSTQDMSFPEAVKHLAAQYNIDLAEAPKAKKNKAHNRAMKFRDAQLIASGIEQKDQVWFLQENVSTASEQDRYQAATIDLGWNVQPGDDMVLHYLDLDGRPMSYLDSKGRQKTLKRVRWANPELHLSKDGKPMKYQSPPGSGSHLWLPQALLTAYKTSEIIETLYITEGEKKSDRMCKADMMSVGIMGIHNFSLGDMPRQFELLIKRCGIKRVVFVLDSDWQDISIKEGKPVDIRPKTFYKAVRKFRDYFYAYTGQGIYLDIFFAAGRDAALKGMDDLLVRGIPKGEDEKLREDFEAAFISRDGKGTYIDVQKITDMSDYQLKEYWSLQAPAAFMQKHGEALKVLRDFQFNKLRWRWDEEEGAFTLAQKILPHEQFWGMVEDKQGNLKPFYVYQAMRIFLNNRGYGLYEHEFDQYRYVMVDGKVVKETSTTHIRRYVRDFVEDIGEPQVLEMILRGGNAYMGADKLADLYVRQLEFMAGDRDTMYMFFKGQFWQITATDITARPLAEMPSYVWENNLIKFEPKLHAKPMINGQRTAGEWDITLSDEAKRCDMLRFYSNTSSFHWRKNARLEEKDGVKRWAKAQGEEPTDDEVRLQLKHFMSKVNATGYLMHDFLDHSCMKAIVCMDGNESEVGRSEGGTGKSIFSDQFEHVLPIEVVDGQQKTIEDDKHIYELVDERTRIITFDDVRVNFNFQWLFSQITRGITVNPKGLKRTRLSPPKFIINTNHAINGDGNSHRRRQYMLGFSDYYNSARTPYDEFGYQLFHDWDYQQWNNYYNFLAACMQNFLRWRLEHTIPTEALERRRLRQQIGESFIEWASLVFDTQLRPDGERFGIMLNKKLERNWLYNKFLDAYPEDKRYTTNRIFKEKLVKYCKYAGLTFNPTTGGERLRSNGKEFVILATKDFDASSMALSNIESDIDFNLNNSTAF